MVQNIHGLSTQELQKACPSIFALTRHESRSERFTQIPTIQVLEGLRGVGFVPTSAVQGHSRIEGKENFTKHLIRLRYMDDLGYSKPDVIEIVLKNAHDGTAAYELMLGVFRLVCTNGLIRGDFTNAMKVAHRGDIVGRVVEGTLSLVEDAPVVMEEMQQMKQVQLSQPEQLLLADHAMRARFDLEPEDDPQAKGIIYQPRDFLRSRRYADQGNDLYSVFNRVQENVVKGGVKRYDAEGKKHSTRGINGIDQNIRLNKLIWSFAQKLLELKEGN